MPEAIDDPSANTQAFQAWVDKQTGPPEPARSKVPLIVGVAVAAVIVVALVAWLALG
jgi:antibiotic biosynthesis monooxygenase (ABM) superfamily enzyme